MREDDNIAIGKRLQIARRFAGFDSAADAATALGVSYPTYSGHERGDRGISRAAEKYARRFRVSLDWLLRGKGPGPGEPAPSKMTPKLAEAVDGIEFLPPEIQIRIADFIDFEKGRYRESRETAT